MYCILYALYVMEVTYVLCCACNVYMFCVKVQFAMQRV